MVRLVDKTPSSMGLPRPIRTKYGVSLALIAAMTGESLSALKRQSVKDPEAFRVKAKRVMAGDYQPEPTEADRADQLEDIIWRVHFELALLSPPDSELRRKLDPVLALTRPVVEAV